MGWTHGERGARAYNGGLGAEPWSPQRGPGAEPLVMGSGGEVPLKLMDVNAIGTLGGRRSSTEDARIEAPYVAWGWGPSQKIYEFFISKWCDMVHSGCVVFKIRVSHGL